MEGQSLRLLCLKKLASAMLNVSLEDFHGITFLPVKMLQSTAFLLRHLEALQCNPKQSYKLLNLLLRIVLSGPV